MAVEHKDDTTPIASKLKSLQEGDNVEPSRNGIPHDDTDDKENLHENNNDNNHNLKNNNNNNNNTDDENHKTNTNDHTNSSNDEPQTNEAIDTTQEQPDGNTEQTIEEGVNNLGIAEPSNFAVKHPLQNSWTIWYDNPGKRSNTASWGDHLRKITSFDTVEDFWRVFNNLKPASALAQGSNYHIFKEFIEPKWEDPVNSKGGKWTVSVPNKNRSSSLDQMWLWTVLACIGETFKSPDDVCGMVVSVRKAGDRVQIWTRDAANEQACRDIGRSLKDALELPESILLGYQSHADSSTKKTFTKNRYEV